MRPSTSTYHSARQRCLSLAALSLILCMAPTARSALLESYDQDSLVFMAEHVIECTLGRKRTQKNVDLWDATVTRVYKGNKAVGDHL